MEAVANLPHIFVLFFVCLIPTISRPWQEIEVGNGNNRLFGGAQYHRALREFNFAVRHMSSPEVTCSAQECCVNDEPISA